MFVYFYKITCNNLPCSYSIILYTFSLAQFYEISKYVRVPMVLSYLNKYNHEFMKVADCTVRLNIFI